MNAAQPPDSFDMLVSPRLFVVLQELRPDILCKWFRTDRIDHARLEIFLAIYEYEQTVAAGTQWDNVKSAQENLRAIEAHANGLVRALEKMPARAYSALRMWLYLRPDSKGPANFDAWLGDLKRFGAETLLPLAVAAHGALAGLPERPRRGRPAKGDIDSPRDAFVRRLKVIYREDGQGAKKRGDPAADAFIRKIAELAELSLPDNIARIVKPKK